MNEIVVCCLLSLISQEAVPMRIIFIIYLHNEYIEKYQFNLCLKYDREHEFDIILEQVVPCRKLR